jgi:hypothetical protein
MRSASIFKLVAEGVLRYVKNTVIYGTYCAAALSGLASTRS